MTSPPATFDEWFSASDHCVTRSERFFDSLVQFTGIDAENRNLMIWLEAAFNAGQGAAPRQQVINSNRNWPFRSFSSQAPEDAEKFAQLKELLRGQPYAQEPTLTPPAVRWYCIDGKRYNWSQYVDGHIVIDEECSRAEEECALRVGNL